MQALLAGINYLVLSIYLTPSSYGQFRGLLAVYTFAIVISGIGFNPLIATRGLGPGTSVAKAPFSVSSIPLFSILAYIFIVSTCYKFSTSLGSVVKTSICLYLMYLEIVLSSLVDFWCIRINKTHWIFAQLVAPALVRLLGTLLAVQLFSPGYKLIFALFTLGSISSLLISICVLSLTGFFDEYVNLLESMNIFRCRNYFSTLKTSLMNDPGSLYTSLSWSLQSAATSTPLLFIATIDAPEAAAAWANLTLIVRFMFLPVTSYYARKIYSRDYDILDRIDRIMPQSKLIFIYTLLCALSITTAVYFGSFLPYNLSNYVSDQALCLLVFGTGLTSVPVVFIRANHLKPQLSRTGFVLSLVHTGLLISMLCLIRQNLTLYLVAIVIMTVDIAYTATAVLKSRAV